MPAAAIVTLDAVGDDLAGIERLVADAVSVDGHSPLNEAALLHLRHGRPGIRHLIARDEDRVVGYAQLKDAVPASTALLVVAPAARRRGIGRALLDRLLELAAHPLQIWAMGDLPAAAALVSSAGLRAARALSIMTRRLDDDLPEPRLPPGVTIRPFRPGEDEERWLAVNARAFAHHPEQGRITRADLDERVAEPWFDPDGFLLAERDGRVIGFHWTKQHPGRLGEVYVLGVDPDAAGGGVGKALLLAGLRYLRSRGNTEVELYVESDHTAAVALYSGAGFTESSRDVLYRQPAN